MTHHDTSAGDYALCSWDDGGWSQFFHTSSLKQLALSVVKYVPHVYINIWTTLLDHWTVSGVRVTEKNFGLHESKEKYTSFQQFGSSKIYIYIYIYIFKRNGYQRGCIKLIKSDRKYLYNVTNIYVSNKLCYSFIFLFIIESWNKCIKIFYT